MTQLLRICIERGRGNDHDEYSWMRKECCFLRKGSSVVASRKKSFIPLDKKEKKKKYTNEP